MFAFAISLETMRTTIPEFAARVLTGVKSPVRYFFFYFQQRIQPSPDQPAYERYYF
jgi:hypothetical protein